MNRRRFLNSVLGAVAFIGATKLGLGNALPDELTPAAPEPLSTTTPYGGLSVMASGDLSWVLLINQNANYSIDILRPTQLPVRLHPGESLRMPGDALQYSVQIVVE